MAVNKPNRKKMYVFADWESLSSPQLMGILYSEVIRGKEIFSFEYDNKWLKSDFVQILDPDLIFYSGIQYLSEEKLNFGLFLDSSPDRWGRLLMKRREAAYARKENRPEKRLCETDYLLGVNDELRMGAIRFKEDLNGAFLKDDTNLTIPPWASLPELEHVSLKLEDNNSVDDPEYITWLNMLVNPGSSLGGARPKAGVTDKNNNLWIAKFPGKFDTVNIGGWEMLANKLAIQSGVKVATASVEQLTSRHYTFLSKRFDRSDAQSRIHFASAMTLLGYSDGDDYHTGASYLELAEFIMRYGANLKQDLEELWRRIVFSIAISNTDDHLRNHGFLLSNEGWILSPAYDINPVAEGTGLKLNISENDNTLDINVALGVIDFFRIKEKKAQEIISTVKNAVLKWQKIADELYLPRNEQALMAHAFSRVKEF